MGGEWWFTYKPKADESPFDMDKYKALLLTIRNEHRHKFKNFADWCYGNNPTNGNNVFATFKYNCKRETCLHNEENGKPNGKYGYGNSIAAWHLYWDPSIVLDGAICSDVYARCAPQKFIENSVIVQKMVAKAYPKHFQLYLGDDEGGCGPRMDQYWGIVPSYKTKNNPNYNASDDSDMEEGDDDEDDEEDEEEEEDDEEDDDEEDDDEDV